MYRLDTTVEDIAQCSVTAWRKGKQSGEEQTPPGEGEKTLGAFAATLGERCYGTTTNCSRGMREEDVLFRIVPRAFLLQEVSHLLAKCLHALLDLGSLGELLGCQYTAHL
jgi:hypothetical protein